MSQNRGDLAEQIVETALHELLQAKKILGYIHAAKNRELDSLGIDFLVVLLSGLVVPLQVKASWRRIKAHRQKHPLVKFVVALEYQSADLGRKVRMDLKILRNELIRIFNEGISDTHLID